MNDRIVIRGLRAFGHHGVSEAERREGRELVVDLDCLIDAAAAGASDDLTDTADYSQIAPAVAELVRAESYKLLETLAGRIAQVVLENEKVKQVTVSVAKHHLSMGAEVGSVAVQITRP